MPEEIVMVSTCPLCAGPEEVLSMVTVEIDRIIPKGRAAIVICRSCVGATIRAARHADPDLLDLILTEREQAAIRAAASEPANFSAVSNEHGELVKRVHTMETAKPKREPDDDSSTN